MARLVKWAELFSSVCFAESDGISAESDGKNSKSDSVLDTVKTLSNPSKS